MLYSCLRPNPEPVARIRVESVKFTTIAGLSTVVLFQNEVRIPVSPSSLNERRNLLLTPASRKRRTFTPPNARQDTSSRISAIFRLEGMSVLPEQVLIENGDLDDHVPAESVQDVAKSATGLARRQKIL